MVAETREYVGASRYRAHRTIGAGGMGTVFHATDLNTGASVAIKRHKNRGTTRESVRELKFRTEREIEILRSISHPNAIKFLDSFVFRGEVYSVTEYVEGVDLEQYSAIPRGIEETIAIAIEFARAVNYLHECGVIHRDLKPSNVLRRTVDGKIILTDFGLAKCMHDPTGRWIADPNAFTSRVGTVVGTLRFMPPEQAQSKDIDPRADVFSFGVTLVYLLIGSKAISTKRLRIPAEFSDLISRMTKKKPKKRIASMAHVIVELQELQKEFSQRQSALDMKRNSGSVLKRIISDSNIRFLL